jgi:SNF2 family DNA or RNA helicase
MSLQFIITITEHRYLGWIAVPALAAKDQESFISIREQITIARIEGCGYTFSGLELKILKLFDKFSDTNLTRIYSNTKNVADFYAKLTTERFEERIRPFIEKYLAEMFLLIKSADIPVFYRRPNYNNLYENDRINFAETTAETVFNFELEDSSLKYFLTIQHRGENINLLNKNLLFLCNQPCFVIIDQTLFSFPGIDANKLKPFIQKPWISIPETAMDKYMGTFVLNAIKNFKVNIKGFRIVSDEPACFASLFLEENLEAEPILSLKFKYGNRYFISGGKRDSDVTLEKTEEGYLFTLFSRKYEWEQEMENLLINRYNCELQANNFFSPRAINRPDDHESNRLNNLVLWLSENEESLKTDGFEIEQTHFDNSFYIGKIDLQLQMSDKPDWFELDAVVIIGEYRIPFKRFKHNILHNNQHFILPDGSVVVLPVEWFSKYQEILKFAKEEGERLLLDKIHFNLLDENDNDFSETHKFSEIYTHKPDTGVEIPVGINASLRSYQKEGYSWLLHLNKHKFGGILADDMGLGKTLQTLTLLQKIYENQLPAKKLSGQLSMFDTQLNATNESENSNQNHLNASLIVMPKSLVHNWENEIKKFCPALKVYVYSGNNRIRSKDIGKIFNHYHVILTSYGMVRNDLAFLNSYKYHYLILDESHYIKNPASKIYQAVDALSSEYRLALTGTPIENSLFDLWAQFNFINPGLLGSITYFKKHFVVPIQKNANEKREVKLQKIIAPFILRRKKQDVAKDLPPLSEQILFCAMSDEQKVLYDKEKSCIRNAVFEKIESHGVDKSRLFALQALMRLRLMANHPVLTNKEYAYDSGKLDRIIRNLINLRAENHKVLIFSSFVRHLKLLESYFLKLRWKYSMLTGSTQNRKEVIETFAGDPENRIFLISLKAGGVGLNLTEADYVFIIDPWWNPAAEQQAINRAHRIGQDKKVMVYRFITSDSIEEKIIKLQEKKALLAHTFVNENNPFNALSENEIQSLFK